MSGKLRVGLPRPLTEAEKDRVTEALAALVERELDRRAHLGRLRAPKKGA